MDRYSFLLFLGVHQDSVPGITTCIHLIKCIEKEFCRRNLNLSKWNGIFRALPSIVLRIMIMGFNFYITYLKPNFYNKIKAINSFMFYKSFFILLDRIFFFFLPNCTKYVLFNKKGELAVEAILNNLLLRYFPRAAVPLSIGKISFIFNYG